MSATADGTSLLEIQNSIDSARSSNSEGLFLRRLNIESIPPHFFNDLPNITEINLSWNNLSHLPLTLFSLPRLEKLVLRGNRLTHLFAAPNTPTTSSSSSSSLPHLPLLSFLDVAENLLVSLPEDMAMLFPKLQTLIVDVNNLSALPVSPPPPDFLLSTLSASNNQLTVFPSAFLSTSGSSLVSLNFCDNKLSDFPPELPIFENLESLQLGHNNFSVIPAAIFSYTKLQTLALFKNCLTFVPPKITTLSKLVRLDLSFNQLAALPEDDILTMSQLDQLDLRGNDIDRLSLSDSLLKTFGERVLIEGDIPDQIFPGVWLGSYNAAKNRFWLTRNNITHILTVASGLDDVPRSYFKTKTVQVEDLGSEDLYNHFEDCISFIEEALDSNGGVLVHCVAGVSRSATVVAAFLVAKEHLNSNDALSKVKERRPTINPNDGFVLQLSRFSEYLSKRERVKRRPCIIS